MNRRRCSIDGCDATLCRVNKTGLCATHFQAARTINPDRICSHCDRVMRTSSRSGLCGDCYIRSQAKTCAKCGSKFRNARKVCSDLCLVCHRTSPFVRQIPDDRRPDFYLLRQRGLSAQEAVDHINYGLPVVRKNSGFPPAKVTTLEAVRIAGDAMRISPKDVLSEARFSHFVECRSVVVEAMRRQGVPYTQIGRRMGRDHSTIINLHRTFAKRAERNPSLLRVVELIMERAA